MNIFLLLLITGIFPIFSSSAAADTEFELDNHKGKVVYVDFWASWCTPCRASFPFMQSLAEEHGDSLQIVAINVDKNRADADQFLKQFNISFDIVYDAQGVLAESFKVKGMPSSYLYDRHGKLVGSHIGFKMKDIGKLKSAIAEIVNAQE